MKVLLDGGADATLSLTNRTTTAMLASGGNAPEPKVLEAVTLLVDHGVDVNAFNANGQTILHNAAQRGHDSVIEYAAKKGAKLDRRDKQGRTALDLARGAGSGGRRQGRPATAPVVNEKTAALLLQLMQKP
jgi:ankyrin repeat protein